MEWNCAIKSFTPIPFLYCVWQNQWRTRHGYCFCSGGYDSGNNFYDEICFSIIIQHRMIIFVLHIDHGRYFFGVSIRQLLCQSPDLDLISCSTEVFMIRSVSPLPYNIGTPNLVHSLIIVGTCWTVNFLLTLT